MAKEKFKYEPYYEYRATKVACFDEDVDPNGDSKLIRKNYKRNKEQLEERGFSDSELWNLDMSIAIFVYPRLKRLKKIKHGYPSNLTPKKWNKIIDKMLLAFEYIIDDCATIDKEKQLKIEEGLKLFGEYFQHLWD